MRIWYDACTGKHIRYGSAITQQLRKKGHQIIFTARKHPDTIPLARILGENPRIVGEYKPSSLSTRLEESAKRVIEFSRMFQDDPPDIAIAHQSVELCRTAFGLGIPIILTADTPHALAVNRLTIPFATVVVASKAIPSKALKENGAKKIVFFDGVDELAWIKNLKTPASPKLRKPLIVVRQLETKAVYAKNQTDYSDSVVKQLKSLGNIVFLQRYNKKKEFIDSVNLVAHSDLVISAGGTLAREAALLGIPSIVVTEIGKTYVNKYLAEKGFPLFFISKEKILQTSKRYLGKRKDVKKELSKLQNPVYIIEKIVNKISK